MPTLVALFPTNQLPDFVQESGMAQCLHYQLAHLSLAVRSGYQNHPIVKLNSRRLAVMQQVPFLYKSTFRSLYLFYDILHATVGND